MVGSGRPLADCLLMDYVLALLVVWPEVSEY